MVAEQHYQCEHDATVLWLLAHARSTAELLAIGRCVMERLRVALGHRGVKLIVIRYCGHPDYSVSEKPIWHAPQIFDATMRF